MQVMFWRKREAQASIEALQFKDITVQLKRMPYRRTLGLTLQLNGQIHVTAPKQTSLENITSFLDSHTDWIDSRLAKFRELREANPEKQFVDGEEFPLFGRNVVLRLRDVKRAELEGDELIVPLAAASEAVSDFYKEQGCRILRERLAVFSKRMGLVPSSVRLASQKTRWGSCSHQGRVSLNWRLAFAPLEVIDYVVAHELAHLTHFDHSPAFWELVESFVPGSQSLRKWLCSHQYAADFLGKHSELHS